MADSSLPQQIDTGNPGNTLHLGFLDDATVAQIAALSSGDIAFLSEQLAALSEIVKSRKDKLDAVFEYRYRQRADEHYLRSGKDTGVIHITDDGQTITVERTKTVKWDQEALRATLNSLPPDTANHYAKVKVEVEEKKFLAAPPDIQKQLAKARTVTPGKPKYSIKTSD